MRGVGSTIGTLLSQAINLLTIVFLTRYGSEQAIFLLALFTVNLAALAPFVSLRFEIAYVVVRNKFRQICIPCSVFLSVHFNSGSSVFFVYL